MSDKDVLAMGHLMVFRSKLEGLGIGGICASKTPKSYTFTYPSTQIVGEFGVDFYAPDHPYVQWLVSVGMPKPDGETLVYTLSIGLNVVVSTAMDECIESWCKAIQITSMALAGFSASVCLLMGGEA